MITPGYEVCIVAYLCLMQVNIHMEIWKHVYHCIITAFLYKV